MTSLVATRSSIRRATLAVAIVAVSGFVGLQLAAPGMPRLVLAGAACGLFGALALRAPRFALLGLVVWLAALGSMRRILAVRDLIGLGDPLLLVATVTWVALAVVAVKHGALRHRSALTAAVLVLIGLLALSALNPIQGGLVVGLAGVFLIVVPMLAFLVGRALVDERLLRRLLQVVVVLSVAAALYGLWQTFVGFPSWDERWIAERGYAALNVGGVIRAFASFSAASEYAMFLGVGVVVVVAFARSPRRAALAAAALLVLSLALWYESSRGIVVTTLATVVLLTAVRRGVPLWKTLGLVVAALVSLPWLAGQLAPARFGDDPGSALARHQVQGLADPFGEESTLPSHIDMMVSGVTGALVQPVGDGVGAITHAADRFGGRAGGTEVDAGNVGVAAGLPGLLAYGAVVMLGLGRTYWLAARRRDPVAFAALGIVVVTFMQWLNGGHYAVTFLPWLVLGWVDGQGPVAVEPGESRLERSAQ